MTGFSILKIYLQEKQQKEDLDFEQKKKKQGGIFSWESCFCFLGSMSVQPPPEQESEPNQLFATAACLMDGDTGRVLFGKRETDPMAMASTTKIMTCILALENGRRAGSCDSIRPGGSGTESPSRCVARASSFCLAIYYIP